MTKKQKELEGKIIEANQKYREGAPIMSDKEYDLLIDQLKKEYPDSEILTKPIIEENKKGNRMERLPYPMFSLEKVKTISEIRRWVKEVQEILWQELSMQMK